MNEETFYIYKMHYRKDGLYLSLYHDIDINNNFFIFFIFVV